MLLYKSSYLFTLIEIYPQIQFNSLFFLGVSPVLSFNYFKFYGTTNNKYLNPWYITGLSDGDGNFSFSVTKTKSTKKPNWNVQLNYNITADGNSANLNLLKQVNNYFGKIGFITKTNKGHFSLRISGLKSCLIVRDHFIKYPLLTYKAVYFNLWSKALDLATQKRHVYYFEWQEILYKVISLKAHFKFGLSEKLKLNFPEFKLIETPEYKPKLDLININWICGFINADGSFSLSTRKVKDRKLKERVDIEISITQHEISLTVLEKIVKFLGFGSIGRKKDKNAYRVRITSLKNINNFIKLLDETSFSGSKALDYRDFKVGIDLINNKEHLTLKGLKKIKKISNQMNTKRTKFN